MKIANNILSGTGEFSTTSLMANVKIPTEAEFADWLKEKTPLTYIGAPAKPVQHPRPFQIFYYSSSKDSLNAWAKKSRACTVRGAARAGFMRVLDGQYVHVDIYDENDLRVGYVHREKSGKIAAKIAV